MSRKVKFSFLAILIGIGLIFLSGKIYVDAMRDSWNTEADVKKQILASTPMQTIDDIEHYHGKQSYVVALGEDEREQRLLVWIRSDMEDIRYRYVKEGISENILRSNIGQNEPEKKISHIVPAIFEEEEAYEVFYSVEESNGTRYYYDYYRFEDGERLETYAMSKK
ncbi:cell wall elongation regulator TseB-like domain-containing protein [Marinicrinis sediminis]|uniref:DUF5590 domain-containing protein n=1 Tax=Marinicrinis sediminis TaxID=1652465 RepID=A0ABW5RD06_9BACL